MSSAQTAKQQSILDDDMEPRKDTDGIQPSVELKGPKTAAGTPENKKMQKTGELLGDETEGVNQILPHRHKWAWELYEQGAANNWMPTEIPMTADIQAWKSNDVLTEDERLVIKRCLGFFAGSESLVANNLMTLAKWITDPECRQYMARQMYEECLHNHTIVYICDSLDLDIREVYEAYESIPAIKAKDDFLMETTADLNRSDFDTSTLEGKRELFRAAFTYWIVCEGTFFYSGFAMLLSLSEKIPGIAEQIQYTLRDESLHIKFGSNLLNKLKEQYPEIWSEDFEAELTEQLKKAVDLEIAYAQDVLPRGILGLSAEMFVDYMQFIANRRLEALNMSFRYEKDKNPFPWLAEKVDIRKQKNFFETKVTDYQSEGVLDDDF
jgi:ribonucleoside-diphosphate reductase beta chain